MVIYVIYIFIQICNPGTKRSLLSELTSYKLDKRIMQAKGLASL